MTLSTTFIKSIQDIMRQDAGVDGDAQRISQLTWLLFLKIFDDQETELELMRDDYKSPLPDNLRWRSWAADAEGITGDELLDFVNNTLFTRLKALPADAQRNARGFVVRQVFEDAFNYMKSGQLLRQVINRINDIDFNNQQERHLFNDLYEPIRIEEFDVEKAWWGSEADGFQARVKNEFALKVSIDTIKASGFNLDMKNPHRADEAIHDPDHLLAEYAVLQQKIAETRDKLKSALNAALNGEN